MILPLKHLSERIWWAALAYGIALKYVFLEFFWKKIGKNRINYENGYQRQDGKEAVVTGGSRGIGLEIVYNLLQYGYSIVIGRILYNLMQVNQFCASLMMPSGMAE
ncbi:UNVERIFIED_CONTAM: hypothetical protein NCL1_37386 [Trichonephila clavipes]